MGWIKTTEEKIELLWVALFCALGITAGISFYYQLWRSEGLRDKSAELMAVTERRVGMVLKKNQGFYTWKNLKYDDPLYRYEAIQTGPDSTATIKFKNGSFCDIGENSLIVIDKIENLQLNPIEGYVILHQPMPVDSASNSDNTIDTKITKTPNRQVIKELLAGQIIEPKPMSQFFVTSKIFDNLTKNIELTWRINQQAQTDHHLRLQILRLVAEEIFRSSIF